MPVNLGRVFVQRESDSTRKTLVDDRKLFWKKNPKFIFYGFIIASSNVESIIFVSESVHFWTAALGCPKVYRIKSEGKCDFEVRALQLQLVIQKLYHRDHGVTQSKATEKSVPAISLWNSIFLGGWFCTGGIAAK